MSKYVVEFSTVISLQVKLDAANEDQASDEAWIRASEYLDTVYGDHSLGVLAEVSLDGIGAEIVKEVIDE